MKIQSASILAALVLSGGIALAQGGAGGAGGASGAGAGPSGSASPGGSSTTGPTSPTAPSANPSARPSAPPPSAPPNTQSNTCRAGHRRPIAERKSVEPAGSNDPTRSLGPEQSYGKNRRKRCHRARRASCARKVASALRPLCIELSAVIPRPSDSGLPEMGTLEWPKWLQPTSAVGSFGARKSITTTKCGHVGYCRLLGSDVLLNRWMRHGLPHRLKPSRTPTCTTSSASS